MSTRWSAELVSITPFDDNGGSFFVLVNDEEQPQFVAGLRRCSRRLAGGVRRIGPPRGARLDYIQQNATDIRPKSLRERLAAGRAFDQSSAGLLNRLGMRVVK